MVILLIVRIYKFADMNSFLDEKAVESKTTSALDDGKIDSDKASVSTPNQAPALRSTQRQKWYQYFSPTDTPEERRLILKLDGLIMIFVFLAYWAKVLDSSATSTAYVSGMKEDLKLYGNQLNYLNTVYM